jgi:hypothetical protein
MEYEHAENLLRKEGFSLERTPPDEVHFGNWVLIAVREPLAMRVTNDRGVDSLDLMQWDAFKNGANESDWFNWDVVARALEFKGRNWENQLWHFLDNVEHVTRAFERPNWESTRGLLIKIEAQKRLRFMEGQSMGAHA